MKVYYIRIHICIPPVLQNTKNKTAVKLTAVSCAPVVEVKIKRPDTKYQLGFSVQNGVVRNKANPLYGVSSHSTNGLLHLDM